MVRETPFGDDESYIDPLRIIENQSLADKIHESENIVYTQQVESQTELIESNKNYPTRHSSESNT